MGRPSLTDNDKTYILNHYPEQNSNQLAKYLGRAKRTILNFLKEENIYYDHKELPPKDIEFIKKYYKHSKIDWIAKKLDKSRRSIIAHAKKYNLYEEKIPSGNLLPLLSNTLESFYWLGFIAADGHIADCGLLTISQHTKDKDRIYLLSKYLSGKKIKRIISSGGFNCSKNRYTYVLNIYQKEITDKIRKMFGLKKICKTHSGIKLDFLKTQNQAISFLLGFMDGDANIRHDTARIQCYKTWLSVFEQLCSLLPQEYQKGNISLKYKKPQNSYYATWNLHSNPIRLLKKFAIDNNIPISSRKWASVDISKIK